MALDQMKILADMQKLDDKIGSLRVLQQELPKQLAEIIDRVDAATAKLLAEEGERNELNKKQRSLEGDIKTANDQIRKYGNQLSEIKTNKEYKALNSEIAYLKEKISELESQEIELMDQDAILKARVETAKQELAAAEDQKRQKEDDLRQQIAGLETQIEETRATRNQIAAGLPHTLIRQYGMMIKNKNNLAVVYNRNGACGGCGFVIRPQIRIELQLRKKIILCESCGRILLEPFEQD